MVEHERDGELDERDACLLCGLREVLDGVELALVRGLREVEALGQPVGARGGLLSGVLAPAARQPAAGQGAVGHDGHAVAQARGQDVGLSGPDEHRVRRLLGDEPLQKPVPRDPLRFDDLAGREREDPM